MTSVWALAALWLGLAVVATLLSIWLRISTALSEIAVGTIAPGMSAIRLHPKMTPPRLDCMARTERFELLNPETRGKCWAIGPQFSSQKGVDFCGEGSVTVAVPS